MKKHLRARGSLAPGDSLRSSNDQFSLVLQADGNLVLYDQDGAAIWATGTDGQDVAKNLEIVKIRNASTVNDDTKKNGLGWFNLDVLRQVEQALFDLGLTKNRVNVADVFTNELVQG